MSDDHSDDTGIEPSSADTGSTEAADTGAAAPRPVRRPRPAPTTGYVPGRRSRTEQTSGMNPIIVPIIALIALLALLGALLFDHYHKTNTVATSTAIPTVPTQAPLPTAPPTATPIPVNTPV